MKLLVSQEPAIVHNLYAIRLKDRVGGIPHAMVEFWEFCSRRLIASDSMNIPSSFEELQLELQHCEIQSQMEHERIASLRQETRLLQSMEAALPSIADLVHEIRRLESRMNAKSLVERRRLRSFREHHSHLEAKFRHTQKKLETALRERLEGKREAPLYCSGCNFFGSTRSGGLCSKCFMKTSAGSAIRKERYKIEETVSTMMEERRSDHVSLDKQCTMHAQNETISKIQEEVQRVRRLANDQRTNLGQIFVDPGSIWSALGDGDAIVLVRASWLKNQSYLPKRPLPPEAVIGVGELRKIHERMGSDEGRSTPLPIIAISHCWRSKDHPDPNGETCKRVVNALNEYWPKFGVRDMGIFIDWSSLYQNPRTPPPQTSFKSALRSMSLWFGHSQTTVWLVTDKQNAAATSFWDRGWTTFEYCLAHLIKPANTSQYSRWPQVLDLGNPSEPKVLPHKYHPHQERFSPQALLYRPAPPDPLAFYEGHSFGHQLYTNGADRDEVVAPQFCRAVLDILAGARTLNFSGHYWGDEEAKSLARVLPLCYNLKTLQLSGNRITSRGFEALFKCISEHRKEGSSLMEMRELWVYENPNLELTSFAPLSGVAVYFDELDSIPGI